MSMIHFETDVVQIPVWVSDLGSFRRWMDSDEAPEKATVSYLAGEVRIDMSKEQLYSHNRVKTEFARVLATLAWSGLLSFGILKAIDVTIGLRVPKTDEQEGLDLSENGELAYGVFGGTMVEPRESLPSAPSPAHAPLLVPTES